MLLLRRILQQEEVVSRMKSPEHSTLIQENLRAFAGTTLAFRRVLQTLMKLLKFKIRD